MIKGPSATPQDNMPHRYPTRPVILSAAMDLSDPAVNKFHR